jgi:hypothetical protein
MPAQSEKQRRFMGAELARKRAGKKTQTGMSEKQLEEFASKRRKERNKSGHFTCLPPGVSLVGFLQLNPQPSPAQS